MNITIKNFVGEAVRTGADIALKHRLYVSGWSLSGTFKSIRDYPYNDQETRIVIAYHDGVPVGVGLLQYGTGQFFVRKSMRRNKIGTMLAKALSKMTPYRMRYGDGIDGSDAFFTSPGMASVFKT